MKILPDTIQLILIHTPSLVVIHNSNLDLTSHHYYVHLHVFLDQTHLQIYINVCINCESHILLVWLWVLWNGEKKISRPYRLLCRYHNFHPSLSNFLMCKLRKSSHCQPQWQWEWVLYWDSCPPMISSWISDHYPCKSCSTQQVSLQSTSQGKLHACSYQSNYLRE